MSNPRRRIARRLAATCLAAVCAPALAEQFTFAVEPSYPPDRAREIYQPLIEHLERTTGHEFELITTPNYHFHWRDLRENKPVDFVFEEAHFTDYRAQRYGYLPLARPVEDVSYTLLATPERAERGLDGLVGYPVISMPSPSLGYALLGQMYPNPMSQPDVKSEATSWRETVEIVFAGDGEGAIVPTRIAELYPNLVTVQTSESFPGPAVSAASTVPEDVRAAVRDALLSMHEGETVYEALVELGATQFEPAAAADYAGDQRLLRGFFGYAPPAASQ